MAFATELRRSLALMSSDTALAAAALQSKLPSCSRPEAL